MLDVIIADPAAFVVVNTTTVADEESGEAGTRTIDVLELTIADPAWFVVVYATTVADGDSSG